MLLYSKALHYQYHILINLTATTVTVRTLGIVTQTRRSTDHYTGKTHCKGWRLNLKFCAKVAELKRTGENSHFLSSFDTCYVCIVNFVLLTFVSKLDENFSQSRSRSSQSRQQRFLTPHSRSATAELCGTLSMKSLPTKKVDTESSINVNKSSIIFSNSVLNRFCTCAKCFTVSGF